MSEGQQGLDSDSVELLLELLELREPCLSGAAAELRSAPASRLIAAGLIVPDGHEAGTASQADHDDVPVSLIWSDAAAGMAYFSPAAGLVPVSRERLVRHRVDFIPLLSAITQGLDRQRGRPAFSLCGDVLWEIGEVRLGRRSARVPLWFARRLGDPEVRRQVADAARARPHTQLRVILASARPSRIVDVEVAGATVVTLRHVLARPDGLAVSPDILDARLRGVPAQQGGQPLVLSPDGRQLRINDQSPIAFKTDPQVAAIRKLVDAHRRGERLRIGELSDHGSLSRLFGRKKWALLKPYISSVNGLWGFDL